MLNLVMAVSKEDMVARGPDDNMSWTGSLDKSIFRLLTFTNPVIGMSRRSILQLPGRQLPGRKLIELSRYGLTVESFAESYPCAWLGAGPSLAVAALEAQVVSKVFLVHLGSRSIGFHGSEAVRNPVTPYVSGAHGHNAGWDTVATIAFPEETMVCVYHRKTDG